MSGGPVTAGRTRAVERDFPGWRVWRSQPAGTWWATRTGPDARCDREDPRPMTVDGADEGQLRAALEEAESPGACVTGMLA